MMTIAKHPGGVLYRNWIQPLGLDLTTVADALGVNISTVSRIVNEKADITAKMALRISYSIGGTADMWIGMQNRYNLENERKIFFECDYQKLNSSSGRYSD